MALTHTEQRVETPIPVKQAVRSWIIVLSTQEEAVEGKKERLNERNGISEWGELVYSAISIKEIGLH